MRTRSHPTAGARGSPGRKPRNSGSAVWNGVLCDYRNLLRHWKRDYAPNTPDEDFHPLFVEALQKQDYVDYLLDVLLSPDMEERAAFIIDCGKEVSNLERRMAELAAGDTAGRRTDHARITAAPER